MVLWSPGLFLVFPKTVQRIYLYEMRSLKKQKNESVREIGLQLEECDIKDY